MWAVRLESSFSDGAVAATGIAVDLTGGIFITGRYTRESKLFNAGGSLATQIASEAGADSYVAKYTSEGNLEWSTTIRGSGAEITQAIATDLNGNAYVTGTYDSTVAAFYDAGSLSSSFSRTKPEYACSFLAQYSNSGKVQWITTVCSSSMAIGVSIAADGNDVCLLASFQNTISIYDTRNQLVAQLPGEAAPSETGLFKFSLAGAIKWAAQVGNTGFDSAGSVTIDAAGMVGVSGTSLQVSGVVSAFLAQFDPNGKRTWYSSVEGGSVTASGVSTLDIFGSVVFAGVVARNPTTFMTQNALISFNMTRPSVNAVFLSKYYFSGDLFTLDKPWLTSRNSPRPTNSRIVWSTSSVATSSSFPSKGSEGMASQDLIILVSVLILAPAVLIGAWLLIKQYRIERSRPERRVRTILPSRSLNGSANPLNPTPVSIPLSDEDNRTKSSSKEAGGATVVSNRSQATTFSTTTTWVGTSHELAVPAYMELEWGFDYKQGNFITEGGGGQLYKCWPINKDLMKRANRQPLAVKRVSESIETMDQRFSRAFWQEVGMMNRFRDNQSFCQMYGHSMRPVCIIMKFYQYGDLSKFIARKSVANNVFPYTKRRLMHIFYEYCKAIAYMHESGFAHSDIKPGNVLLDVIDNELSPVVTDFGISRVISKDAISVRSFEVSDMSGASVPYAAPGAFYRMDRAIKFRDAFQPEVIQADDSYSLAISLLEMLTRLRPWFRQSKTRSRARQ